MITITEDDCGNKLKKEVYVDPCPNPNCFNKTDIKIHLNFDYVWCHGCGMRGPMFDGHIEDAIFGWNDLTQDLPLGKRLE